MKLSQAIIGVASFIAGASALREAFKDEEEEKGLGRASPWERLPGLPKLPQHGGPTARVTSVRNIDQRVHYVKQQIIKGRRDPRIRELAVRLVSKKCGGSWCIPERDYQGELRAIFNYTRQNVRYVRDPVDRDTFQHPRRTLEWGGEDCDGATIVVGSLVQAIGYPYKCRVIQTVYGNDYDHIYGMAGVPPTSPNPKIWLPMDASVDKPAFWEAPRHLVKRVKDFTVT